MKFQLLYLAALASASVLQRDIQKPAYGNLTVVKIEKLTPQITKSAKAQITKFGPLTVQGVRLPLPKNKHPSQSTTNHPPNFREVAKQTQANKRSTTPSPKVSAVPAPS